MLTFPTLTPNKSLNKAFRKEKVSRAAVDRLKHELLQLVDRIAQGVATVASATVARQGAVLP